MANECVRCEYRTKYVGARTHWCAKVGIHIEGQIGVVKGEYVVLPHTPAPDWCPGMKEKVVYQYQVVNKFGVAWAMRFVSEDGAWGRLTSLKKLKDSHKTRVTLMQQGWSIRRLEVTSRPWK